MSDEDTASIDLLDRQYLPSMIRELRETGQAVKEMMQLRCGTVICNALLVREALERANVTVGYHENTVTPTYLKQLAHFCHWIMRLKPLRTRRLQDRPLLQRLAIRFGMHSEIDNEGTSLEDAALLINEYTAILYAMNTVTILEEALIDGRLGDGTLTSEQAADCKAKLEARIQELGVFGPSMASSFREHTYSARGTAMIFELAFSTQLGY